MLNMESSSEPLLSPYSNWPLMQGVLALLRESRVGLSCASVVELAMERAMVGDTNSSSRSSYQRVYRTLQQLESMGLIRKEGRRFLVNETALRDELAKEAEEVLQKALESPLISGDPNEIQEAFKVALGRLLNRPEGP